uniref:Uncharacterized protein n=1 Tax=Fagus sylvatica TaxID=28930 RepID=A0A2N9GUP2_FAGSY
MDSRLIYGPVESFSMYCSLASILFKVREFDGNVYQNRKIFKAQFELPPYDFVQFQAARHQPRLTDTIWPPMIRVPWFCKGGEVGYMFTFRFAVAAVVGKIEMVAKGLSYKVWKVKDFKVSMEGTAEGHKEVKKELDQLRRLMWLESLVV